MKMRYSPSAPGFFPDDIDYGSNLPGDLIEISDELYTNLMNGQSEGKVISMGADGLPELTDPPAPTQEELVAAANNNKASILQSINTKTQMWQTQLALGIITDKDKVTLTAWMRYAQQVQAVDTSSAPDITWPDQPS